MSAARGLVLGVALVLTLSGKVPAEDAVNTCIGCHVESDEEELSSPVEEWSRSTHAKVEVSCDACHGGNPLEEDEELSMSEDEAGFVGKPSWDEVPELCGACHEQILEGYRESVMASHIESGERVAVCTTCHMTQGHDIERVTPREILTAENCGKCHDPQRALDLLSTLESTSEKLQAGEAAVSELHGRIDTGRLDRELSDITDRYLVVVHTYDLARIGEVAAVCSTRLDSVDQATRELHDALGSRRRIGIGVTGFFACVCIAAIRLESNLKRSRK